MIPFSALSIMVARVSEILSENCPSVYLTGSVTLDDFHPGWSDIDLLVLTEREISPAQAEALVGLRQDLVKEYGDGIFRLFEGGMLTTDAFVSGGKDRVVYWGTSGQRVTNQYRFDAFCTVNLLDDGVLLCGDDVRGKIPRPDAEEIRADMSGVLDTVRRYASLSGNSLYTYSWLLDISCCLFTLKTENHFQDARGRMGAPRGALSRAGRLVAGGGTTHSPASFRKDALTGERLEDLVRDILSYADTLEKTLSLKKEEAKTSSF